MRVEARFVGRGPRSVLDPHAMVDAPKPVAAGAPALRLPDPAVADPTSAMMPRFNVFFRWFARRFFPHFDTRRHDRREAPRARSARLGRVRDALREPARLLPVQHALRARGAPALGLRERPRPSSTTRRCCAASATGRDAGACSARRGARRIASRPVPRPARWCAPASRCSCSSAPRGCATCCAGARPRSRRGGAKRELLAEIVRDARADGKPVSLVPLALFWRKGPRGQAALPEPHLRRPDAADATSRRSPSFLIAYRELAIKVGEPIDLTAFVEQAAARRRDDVVARKLRRAILLFLTARSARSRARCCGRATACRRSCCATRRVEAAVGAARARGGRHAGGRARRRPRRSSARSRPT